MGRSKVQQKAEDAWERIQALGGHGVWERELVVVALNGTKVTDADLALFQDFPFVQILDLSATSISDAGLAHLTDLPALEDLIVTGTRITKRALQKFQQTHPDVQVTTEPPPKGTVNPFTGEAC